MKIACIADIHANAIALDAVLNDIHRQGGVDATWVLGDLVAFGAQPIEVLARLVALPNTQMIRGNTDVYVRSGLRPAPSITDVRGNPDLLPVFEEVALSIGWTQGMLTAAGFMPRLDQLPLDVRTTLPDGTRVLLVHAEPGKDTAPGLTPVRDKAELAGAFADADADLVLVGHTHWPMTVESGPRRLVNPGSVGNPLVPGQSAAYALIEADEAGYTVRHRLVAYDTLAALAMFDEVRHPAPHYPAGFLRGEQVRPWPLPPVEYA